MTQRTLMAHVISLWLCVILINYGKYSQVNESTALSEQIITLERVQKLNIARNATKLVEVANANNRTREELAALRTEYDKHVRGFRPIGSQPGSPEREEKLEPFPDPINETK